MNAVVWILQSLLAAMFLAVGIGKLVTPRQRAAQRLPWVEDVSAPRLKAIGAVEALGGLGVLLPSLTGIAPVLSPIAATGLAIVMLLAMLVHVRRNEYSALVANVVLFALAVVVAWARFGPYAL